MKMNKILVGIVMASIGTSRIFAGAGIFDSLLWTTPSSPLDFGESTFYNIDPANELFGSAEFQGTNLGSFELTDNLYIWGEQKSSKDNGTDVQAHTLHFEVRDESNSIEKTGSINMVFRSDLGSGNQTWASAATGSTTTEDIITGLAVGNYTLGLWTSITTNGTDADTTIFNNNGGSNYVADFTVIPEPSSIIMVGLTGLAAAGLTLLKRRRKA